MDRARIRVTIARGIARVGVARTRWSPTVLLRTARNRSLDIRHGAGSSFGRNVWNARRGLRCRCSTHIPAASRCRLTRRPWSSPAANRRTADRLGMRARQPANLICRCVCRWNWVARVVERIRSSCLPPGSLADGPGDLGERDVSARSVGWSVCARTGGRGPHAGCRSR